MRRVAVVPQHRDGVRAAQCEAAAAHRHRPIDGGFGRTGHENRIDLARERFEAQAHALKTEADFRVPGVRNLPQAQRLRGGNSLGVGRDDHDTICFGEHKGRS